MGFLAKVVLNLLRSLFLFNRATEKNTDSCTKAGLIHKECPNLRSRSPEAKRRRALGVVRRAQQLLRSSIAKKSHNSRFVVTPCVVYGLLPESVFGINISSIAN